MDLSKSQDPGASQCDIDAERGATAVEYGIMLATIAGVIVAVVLALGGQVFGLFEILHARMGAFLGP